MGFTQYADCRNDEIDHEVLVTLWKIVFIGHLPSNAFEVDGMHSGACLAVLKKNFLYVKIEHVYLSNSIVLC